MLIFLIKNIGKLIVKVFPTTLKIYIACYLRGGGHGSSGETEGSGVVSWKVWVSHFADCSSGLNCSLNPAWLAGLAATAAGAPCPLR